MMEISVIIPVFNAEKYLDRCIQSILRQTFQDFEIIIVNDCSQDGSMVILRECAQKDKRITVLENERNMGSMWSRRVGYRHANGKYFIFCDSDDFFPENAFEMLHSSIVHSKSCLVVGNAQYATDAEFKTIKRNTLSFGNHNEALYRSLMTGELSHCLWGKIYDRKIFEDKTFETFQNLCNGEDGVLFYQLAFCVKKVTAIEDIVYFYYLNPESATRSTITENKAQAILFSSDYISRFIKKNKPELIDLLNRRETKVLLSLLTRGVKCEEIKLMTKEMDFVKLKSYRSIHSCYKGIYSFLVWLLLNSGFFRRAGRSYLNNRFS